MRVVTEATQTAWESAYKGGDQVATTRVTISRLMSHDTTYDQSALPGTHRVGSGVFRSAIFGQADQPVELPNVAKVTINRGIDQDAATCTLELWNTRPLSMGEVPTATDLKQIDLPGWFTAGRGTTSEAIELWEQTPNGWRDYIQPDRIIKTYQGYGVDLDQPPETDPNLYITGVWMIDDVEYTADGLIRVTCRDLARLLLDQLCLPPTVPWAEYPLRWEAFRNVDNPDIISSSLETAWFTPTYRTDSNVPYIGKGFTDGSIPYVRSDGSVLGHKGAHAFDASLASYWLSVGNYANWSSAYEYVEGQFSARSISAVEVAAWGGPYTVYVSVMVGGVWQGASKIPYRARAVDTNADIRFVKKVRVAKNGTLKIPLPKAYANATRVRITFTDLYDSGIGRYQYRAGCRRLRVLGTSSVVTSTDGGTHVEGNYGDFSDIIRLLCSWGGLYWPQEDAYVHQSDGTLYSYPPGSDDLILSTGRAWGDFESTGTAGVADLDESMWDKVPLMDGISQIRDMVGFNFFIDETGGAIWRMPNIWSLGNYVHSLDGGPHLPARTPDLLEIRDDRTLLGYSAKLSSRNVRDHVLVATTSGRYGAVATGYNPSPTGFDRVGGWCVDTETEILTKRGWLRYDEVLAGDETLSIDASSGKACWQPIREVAVFPAAERDMTTFTANNFSARTTADHRWLVERYSTATGTRTRRYARSSELTSMDRIPRAASGAAAVERTLSDDLVELVAWTYTEGCIKRPARAGWRSRVALYQDSAVNPETCERIRLALKREFADGWSEHTRRESAVCWTIGADRSAQILHHIGDDKQPTMDFLCALTQEQLDLFIDTCIAGDGHVRTNRNGSRSYFFYQNVDRLDAFLTACALAGRATSSHVRGNDGRHGDEPHAATTLLSEGYFRPAGTITKDIASEIVWCPAMPEHHNWLARRRGAVYFTGNTDQRFSTEDECQIMADLITMKQSFEYRTAPVTIPGHPGVQIDDQVRVYERVTSDTFVHYVKGLSHTWERVSGRWTMDLDVHWLGEEPGSRWAFDPTALAVVTQRYLAALGYVTSVVGGDVASPGDPGTTPSTPPGELPPPEGPYTTVLFEDTFSGSSVDTSKWNVRSDSQSNHNGRNSPAACTVNGGQLHIRSGLSGDSAKPWTSGYLDTIGKSSFRYGRWEIRCRFPWGPTGAGYWPAFWLRPDDGGIGEIDIMEAWANRKSAHNSLWRDYTGTPHKEGQQFAKVVPGYVGTDWHTYAVEKDPGVLRFYIDDILVWTATASNVPWFTETFDRAVDWNIRLQLQIGGSYEGTPTSSTILSQTYDVDYVRVTGA